MVIPAPTPEVSAAPFPAAGFAVRPMTAPDAASLIGFGGAPGTHYLCFGSDAYQRESHEEEDGGGQQTLAAFVAVARDGRIVGMARLASLPGSTGSAELTVAVQAAYERLGLLGPLLEAIVAESRGRGLQRLVTSVECHRCNPMEDFRGAGLRAVSWLGIGGVTEVVLAIE